MNLPPLWYKVIYPQLPEGQDLMLSTEKVDRITAASLQSNDVVARSRFALINRALDEEVLGSDGHGQLPRRFLAAAEAAQ